MQVFNPWNSPTGKSSCHGRLQKKEEQILTTNRYKLTYNLRNLPQYHWKLACMVQQTRPHQMAQNLAEKEDDDELVGPSLLLQAMEERERQYKEEGGDKSNPKGDYKLPQGHKGQHCHKAQSWDSYRSHYLHVV